MFTANKVGLFSRIRKQRERYERIAATEMGNDKNRISSARRTNHPLKKI